MFGELKLSYVKEMHCNDDVFLFWASKEFLIVVSSSFIE